MKSIKRFTAIMLSIVMVLSNLVMTGAATAKATTLRLEQTEGTAALKNSNGTAKTIKAGMKLYNGDALSTEKSSYAYISLDSTKAVKLDESSSVTIKQNGKENEVMVNSGSLIFNVTVPLEKKESLNIRTSTMVTGVRGTIGFAEKISEEESEIYILEGKVELTSIDSKTGKSSSVFIYAGEKGVCRRVKAQFDKKNKVQVPEVKAEKFTEDDIPVFVIIEIGRNKNIQDRLRKVGIFDVDKILEKYKALGDNGTYVTIEPDYPVTGVSSNNTVVSSNAVSGNKTGDGGSSGGGGGAGGSGGGSSGGASGAGTGNTGNNGAVSGNAGTVSGNNGNSGSVSGNSGNNGTVSGNDGNEGTVSGNNGTVSGNGGSVSGNNGAVSGNSGTVSGNNGNVSGNNGTPTPTPVITTASVSGAGQYVYGEPVNVLSVTTEIENDENAITTYQWYVAADETADGTEIPGATDKDYTPAGDTIGSKYYYCVVTTKASEESAEVSQKTTDRVEVTIDKKSQVEITAAPVEPEDKQIGFNSVTLEPVTTLSSISSFGEYDNIAGGKIKLTGVVRLERPAINDPGKTVSADAVEYAKSETTTAPTDDDDWQKSRTFDRLSQGTTYYFFARLAATDTVKAGKPSDPISITTKTLEGEYLNPVISGNGLPAGIYFETNLDGYNGSVSPNAVVYCVPKENANLQSTPVDELVIPGVVEFYDIDIKVTKLADGIFWGQNNPSIIPKKVVLPDTLERIGVKAFYGLTPLTDINIPDSVTEIGQEAFESCTGLTDLVIGDGVKSIEINTFSSCTNLTSVVIGDKVETIGQAAFGNCLKLTSVVFGDAVKTIGYQAFYQCLALESVSCNGLLETIGGIAFEASGLKEIRLNNGLKNIGKNAFTYCDQLNEIIIPGTVTSVSGNDGTPEENPFYYCGLTAIHFIRSTVPDGWQEGWNYKNGNNIVIPTCWYVPEENDPTTVSVYSPEATYQSSGMNNPELCTQLSFTDSGFNEYEYYINSGFLTRMFELYYTVIIPSGNVAILDSDLVVPEEKTLVIDGDLSTENFNVAGFGREGNVSFTHNRNVVHGMLTNNGTIKITGNFYTSNNRLDCEYDDNTNPATDVTLSSTVSSENGKMELSGNGHMTVIYAYLNIESSGIDYYTINERVGLNISDISIADAGIIDLYGYNASIYSDHNHHSGLNANLNSGISVDEKGFFWTLSKDGSVEETDSFGLNYIWYEDEADGSIKHRVMNISDSAGNIAIVYDEMDNGHEK